MDGYRLCLEIKRDPRLQVIPIIVCSNAYTSEDDEQFARKLGADKYLLKPVSPDAVFEAVRNIQSNPVRRQPAPLLENELEMMTHYSERLLSRLERQHSQLLRQTEELRASGNSSARWPRTSRPHAENEAIRIAREVHDGLGQALTALNIDVSWLTSRISKFERRTAPRGTFETASSDVRAACGNRPDRSEDLRGIAPRNRRSRLVATLEWHAEEFTTRTGVHCTWLERPERVNLERGKATAGVPNLSGNPHQHSAPFRRNDRKNGFATRR